MRDLIMSYLKSFKRSVFYFLSWEKRNFYLYKTVCGKFKEINESDITPKINNLNFVVVRSVQQLEELALAGFEISMDREETIGRLEKGAIAFLIFVDKELAFRGWSALTPQSKATINLYPYKVDFTNHEACIGGAWTNPKYRGKGLFTYETYKRQQFLEEIGVQVTRCVVEANNSVSQKVHARFNDVLYAKFLYFRIFGLQFWNEKPIIAGEDASKAGISPGKSAPINPEDMGRYPFN
jgi:hypothetical protein